MPRPTTKAKRMEPGKRCSLRQKKALAKEKKAKSMDFSRTSYHQKLSTAEATGKSIYRPAHRWLPPLSKDDFKIVVRPHQRLPVKTLTSPLLADAVIEACSVQISAYQSQENAVLDAPITKAAVFAAAQAAECNTAPGPDQLTNAMIRNLSDEHLEQLTRNTFTEHPGCTSLVRHRIDTGDAKPWKCNPHPISAAKRKPIDQALDELIETGVVQHSNTDASDLCLGAVLLQQHDGVLRPVAFASRSLNAAERNYSVTERECLAIVYALRKFDCYVDGVPFVVKMDMALTWLKRLREPSGRLARWALTLQRYNFVVRYRNGSSNVVADTLSCAPVLASATPESNRIK
nr:uncharacterized protein LOC119178017 [Rhipicephalus microplus]